MKVDIVHHDLSFRFAAGTSRGVLHHKPSDFLILHQDGKTGIGECSIIPGLSMDDEINFQDKLKEVQRQLEAGIIPEMSDLKDFPAIAFGLETAILDLNASGKKIVFDTAFSRSEVGIPINGLVWMGDKDFMLKQIKDKIEQGYRCIKLKIGAIDFETELSLLRFIRNEFSAGDMEIRVDANGAFLPSEALFKINQLSRFHIHSIEQPIRQNQWAEMSELCRNTPVPIVLDEELIGQDIQFAGEILDLIQPQYIILKPSLIGGFQISETWIHEAVKRNISWWATSALESNIGLNAIAQWVSTFDLTLPQGLGTGQLYHNNIPSPLVIHDASLWYDSTQSWGEIHPLS